TVAINASWDVNPQGNSTPGNTNVNVWNATVCAVNAWNTAQDSNGNLTGYYLVIDQSQQLGGKADVTLVNNPLSPPNFALSVPNPTSPYKVSLDPANGNFNGGAFTSTDLCGRVAHEIGHLLGLAEVKTGCSSIMRGSLPNGMRVVNSIGPTDVSEVNNNLN